MASTQARLGVAFVLTAGFMVVEAVTGWLTGSLALLSDAGHMLSDTAALGVALWTSRVAARPADAEHPLGHGRAEVIGAGVTAGGLVVLAGFIVVEAVRRLVNPVTVLPEGMMVVASVGLALNVGMALLLAKGDGLHAKAALTNVVGDALGSVGAIVAGALVAWKGWVLADPLVSLFIAGLIAFGASRVLREVVDVLMQTVPSHIDLGKVRAELIAVQGVEAVHDLFAWTIRPGEEVVTAHLEVEPGVDALAVAAAAAARVQALAPSAHVTVQPEARSSASNVGPNEGPGAPATLNA